MFFSFSRTLLGGIAVVLAAVLFSGCSNTRDGRLYRLYHNMHAQYNGYFYANEAMAEADETLKEGYEENWDEILPIFFPIDAEAAQQVYPLLERAIEKCSNVVDKHTMQPARRDQKDIKWPELNKWIDENYDVIARAHLLKGDHEKAIEVFQYLIRTLDYPDAQAWSNAWLARTYMEMGDMIRASTALLKAEGEERRVEDPEVMAYVYHVYAAFHLLDEDIEAAAGKLEKALEFIPKKKDRARTLFILAQCYEATDQSKKAIDRYQEVVDLRTPYELEFYAKIKQAMAYDRRGGNSEPIIEELEDMLEDGKNETYLDQIYFALAVLALEERRRDDGISLLETSIEVNTDNTRQRMKSFLALGDLYLEDLNYPLSQAYYDSARTYMEEDNERFEEVDNLATNLTELVTQLNIISDQDSLLAICDMDESERLAKIDTIIANLEAEAERRRLEAEAAAAAALAAQDDGGQGMFWPYNAQLKMAGRRNFLDYWGDRPLEDNWRRSRKIGATFSEETELAETGSGTDTGDAEDSAGEIPTREELLAGLPCEPGARDTSLAMIAEAYYKAGLAYKEKMNDPENAIDSWQTLIDRFDDSDVHPTAHYQLFRTYLQREIEENYQNPFCETCNSVYWEEEILRRYPGSEWATLIENPEYADEEAMRREAERTVYEGHLARYYAKGYQETLLAVNEVIQSDSANHFLCQYRLLRAQCIAGLSSFAGGDREAYINALLEVVSSCPDTEEADHAREIVEILGGNTGEEEVAESEGGEDLAPDISRYKHKPFLDHYFAVLVPVGRGKVEEIRATISDFNSEYYGTAQLRVTANLIDRNHQIILIKEFARQDKGMEYFEIFTTNREALIDINSSGYTMFLISSENYVELFKSKDTEGYLAFFEEFYLKGEK